MSRVESSKAVSDVGESLPKRLGPLSLMEVAGGLGDLGTFLPLWLGMVTICGLDPGVSLVLAGAANVLTGLFFGIPIGVQPMKVIAAVAIALGFSRGDIAAAGMSVGFVILVLAVVGGFDRLQHWIPTPVVRGVQWGVALKMAMVGVRMFFVEPGELRSLASLDGLWWAPVGLAVLLVLRQNRILPGPVAVLAIGLIGAGLATVYVPGEELAPSEGWGLIVPTGAQWTRGLVRAAIPQLPMTAVNSVVAVCALAWSLFPERSSRATPRTVAVSVGLMNLVASPIGGMPMCHGSGGLAAQYGFGARSGTSVVLLGVVEIAIGLLFATPAVALLIHFPRVLLGAWIIVAGIELVRQTLKPPRRDVWIAILVPGAVALSTPLVWATAGAWVLCVLVSKLRKKV